MPSTAFLAPSAAAAPRVLPISPAARTVAVTTLGAGRNRDRWADLRAILAWAETEAPDAG
jgi:hypothetical protein